MRRAPNLTHWSYFFMNEEDRVSAEAWMSYGKCFNRPDLVDVFNPPEESEIGQKTARTITIAAKEFCHGDLDGAKCSMMAQCRDYAIEYGVHFGVWGGMTVRERRRYAAARRRK